MELTSLDLNNTIVRFRKVVGQAKYRVTRKLIRRIKTLKSKLSPEKTDELQNKYNKKLERYVEDVQALRRLKPDDVSKFALLNTKTLQELKITSQTPASDRALYKVGTNDVIVSAVEELREKYPNWHQEVPFILQRLGLQYKFRKGERNVADIKKLLKKIDTTSADDDSADQTGDVAIDAVEKPTESLLSKIRSLRKEEKMKRKKKVGVKKAKTKGSRSTTLEKPKKKKGKKPVAQGPEEATDAQGKASAPRSKKDQKTGVVVPPLLEGRSGQMEIRRLRVDSGQTDEDSRDKSNASNDWPTSSNVLAEASSADPFFMDGVSMEKTGTGASTEDQDFVIDKTRWRKNVGMKFPQKSHGLEKKRNMNNCRMDKLGGGERTEPRHVKQGREIEGPQYKEKEKSVKDTNTESALHPSWEAKKKQRLLQQSTLSAPAGKKIKFDND